MMATSSLKGNVFLLLAFKDLPKQDAVKHCLITAGYRKTIAVQTAPDVLNRLSRFPLDFLIMESSLAGIDDTWRLIRLIRSGRFCSSTLPIVIVDNGRLAPLTQLQAKQHQQVFVLADTALDQLPDIITRYKTGTETSKPTVLIIEDDENAAQLAKLCLDRHFSVEVAYDGETGLEAWRTARHDLVLLDVQLPGLSGMDVLQAIRHENPLQPVIIVTAYTTEERHRDLMLGGAAEFIAKPFNVNELTGLCERILEHYVYLRHQTTDTQQTIVQHAINNYLWAAAQCLDSGQAGMASYHVKNALAASTRINTLDEPNDDEWVRLMTEFSSS